MSGRPSAAPLRPLLATAAAVFAVSLAAASGLSTPAAQEADHHTYGYGVRLAGPPPSSVVDAAPVPRQASGDDHPVDPSKSYKNEVSTAVHPRDPNMVLAAFHDFGQNNRSGGPVVVTHLSTDGGATFRQTSVVPLPTTDSYSADPSVAYDSRGRAYVGYLGSPSGGSGNYQGGGLYVARSNDGGKTWPETPIRAVAAEYEDGYCTGTDKPYLAVGPAPRRKGNRHAQWIYLSWQELRSEGDECSFGPTASIRSRIMFTRSRDGGKTFTEPVGITPLGLDFGSMPRVGPDGAVYVSYLHPAGSASCPRASGGALQVVVARSTDGGTTFEKSTVSTTCSSGAVGRGGVQIANSIPSMDIDAATGSVALSWTFTIDETRHAIATRVSRDGGRTWTEGAVVGDITESTFSPWLAYEPGGTLSMLYLSELPGGLYDAYLVTSRDDGITWGDPIKLTSSPSFGAGVWGGFSIGHYMGLDVGANRVAHPMWTDIRTPYPVANQNIWTRSVEI